MRQFQSTSSPRNNESSCGPIRSMTPSCMKYQPRESSDIPRLSKRGECHRVGNPPDELVFTESYHLPPHRSSLGAILVNLLHSSNPIRKNLGVIMSHRNDVLSTLRKADISRGCEVDVSCLEKFNACEVALTGSNDRISVFSCHR